VKYVLLALILGSAAVRVGWVVRRRLRGRRGGVPGAPEASGAVQVPRPGRSRTAALLDLVEGDVWLVVMREIGQRLRSRIFQIGTVVILLAVTAAVAIPQIHHGSRSALRVGVVGTMSAPLRDAIVALGPLLGTNVTVLDQPTRGAAERALENGQLDVAVVDDSAIVTDQPIGSSSSTIATLARELSATVALQHGMEAAGIPPAEAAKLAHPRPLPFVSLKPPKDTTAVTTSVYGLILTYVLLAQYGTWILMGVLEEKSSRVVEVLLATLRPRQLLAGKVIGIGLVALLQALLIVAVALGVGAASGSSLVHGTAPTEVLATLVWVVLGYAFYSWTYAAAGSLAERMEHVQSLAFPVQLPMLLGYISSLTAVGSSTPSTFVQVLAYLPPTAPFAMPLLVALGHAQLWQFLLSMALTIAATVGLARVASSVYRRAILQTGRRVRLSEVLGRRAATAA
jgi:ABC-2 type transport system permease protein